MKSTGVIFQDFSIAGLRKQWELQQCREKMKKKSLELSNYATHLRGRNGNPFSPNPLIADWDLIRPKELTGCKTETRRTRGLDEINESPNDWRFNGFGDLFSEPEKSKDKLVSEHSYACFKSKSNNGYLTIKCPYGVVGDEIWVKETYGYVNDILTNLVYKESIRSGLFTDRNTKWKYPLFMPKAASRIKLEITNISIERVQDITEEGAKREGIEFSHFMKLEWEMWFDKENVPQSAKEMYRNLWINMHGKESWDKNPFVWVIQFTVKSFG